ncbi:MAG: 4-hydroxy-tetrahydrodipicolinate reductase [Bacteroidia bacterium]|jgi:4-hydroxy-tetrahydrodipicolinate reductase|nr:4-hydroxy-tetrahydrodipicolinate reductase [Bacteroidia bacterium]
MKIALLGYGKMGKVIERIATGRGHEVIIRADADTIHQLTTHELAQADVAIEFSAPHAAVANMQRCFEAGVPVVTGTTGWLNQLAVVETACRTANGALFYSSNFSLGVNLFFRLNKYLAALMQPHTGYRADVEEIHHIHKLDAPSGTALTLVNGLQAHFTRQPETQTYMHHGPETPGADELPVVSVRTDEVLGTHTIRYTSAVDRISITHEAFNREGFALGAVVAAEWLPGRKGIFGMDDLLGNEVLPPA